MTSTLLLLLASIIGIYVWENKVIEVVEIEVPVAGLAADLDGFRIAQISDLHGRILNPQWLEQKLTKTRIDAIALTGDYIRGVDLADMAKLEPLLQLLPQIAPTFAVSGNHDVAAGWRQIAEHFSQTGITVLNNAYITLSKGDAQLVLAGLAYPHESLSNLKRTLPATEDTIVLLAHSPRVFMQGQVVNDAAAMPPSQLAAWQELMQRPALTMVGHTHGGQVKLPLLGPVTTATGQLFPKQYIEGLSWEGDGWLYISRGLGYTGLQLRFLSRPELTVFTLKQD